jgi:thioredoxin-related protein
MKKSFYISLMVLVVGSGVMMASVSVDKPKPKTAASKPKPKTNAAKPKPATAIVQNDSVLVWYSPSEGYAKAKKENKILVVDVYTDWCYWCKVMDKETYTNMDIILKMNKYFVAVKFNPENAAIHKINDQELSSDAFLSLLSNGGRNTGYPTTYFWKELTDNSKASAYPGYREPSGFNDILNSWINK